MREEWVTKFCETGEEISSETKNYILGLDDGAADGVADTPLALYLLSSCDIKEDMRDNHWLLYHKIFYNAIVKTEYNANLNFSDDVREHPITNKIDILYPIVSHIAYTMFQNSKDSISHEEIKEIINKAEHDD